MVQILIVDDSPTDSYRFSSILEKHGFEVIVAENAVEGLEKAQEIQPDLILMDVVMPGLNGFQATRQLTKSQETAHIPVIIVTTKDQHADKVWGHRQGAKDYLTKPIDETLLIETIKKAMD